MANEADPSLTSPVNADVPSKTNVQVTSNKEPAPTVTVSSVAQPPTFMERAQTFGALLMVFIALMVVSYVTISRNNDTALGALIGVVTTGTGFYLRGKVQNPS